MGFILSNRNKQATSKGKGAFMRKMYRQGDILLVQVSKIPPKHRKVTSNVLVYGEATGHAHRVQGGNVVQTYKTGSIFVIARKGTTLVHNEHGPIDLEPGKYQLIRQREFNPVANGGSVWSAVQD